MEYLQSYIQLIVSTNSRISRHLSLKQPECIKSGTWLPLQQILPQSSTTYVYNTSTYLSVYHIIVPICWADMFDVCYFLLFSLPKTSAESFILCWERGKRIVNKTIPPTSQKRLERRDVYFVTVSWNVLGGMAILSVKVRAFFSSRLSNRHNFPRFSKAAIFMFHWLYFISRYLFHM